MSSCEKGDVVLLSGNWGVEKFYVYQLFPKGKDHQWKAELIPLENDDPLRHVRRIPLTDVDLVRYDIKLTVVGKLGEYNADFDQEKSKSRIASAINCIEV
jgi:hypothetical protein